MSLRDRLRSMRSGAVDEYDGMPGKGSGAAESASLASGGTELAEFAPRQDGDYHCASAGLFLRFARPVVTETVVTETATAETAAADTAAGKPTADAPASGEFTTSGRFTVQRPFGRPIVYTVLAAIDAPAAYREGITVRRTDTGTRATDRLEFTFEPDAG